MIRVITLILAFTSTQLIALEKLPKEYQVSFGDENAPLEVVQYYSLSCPHCVQVYNEDFSQIQEDYIEQGRLRYVFHPVPMDLSTVQFMCCLEKLSVENKKLLLSVMLEEVSLDSPDFNVVLMKKAMELLGTPLEHLEDDDFIKESQAFHAASEFITQENTLKTVPSLQIGEKVLEQIPDYRFISLMMKKLFIKESDYEN